MQVSAGLTANYSLDDVSDARGTWFRRSTTRKQDHWCRRCRGSGLDGRCRIDRARFLGLGVLARECRFVERQRTADPETVGEMVAALIARIGVDENRETCMVEHQPGHEGGKERR